MAIGIIKNLNDKGFGFIAPDGGRRDLFFHANEVTKGDFRTLNAGMPVSFAVGQSPRGPMAKNIRRWSEDDHFSGQLDSDEFSERIVRVTWAINDEFIKRYKDDPAQLLLLSPDNFRDLVAELLKGFGHRVELVGATIDGGMRIVAVHHGGKINVRSVIECRRYDHRQRVSSGSIRELHNLVRHGAATKGIIVTTSWFTSDAQQYLSKNPWSLEGRDFDGLRQFLNDYLILRAEKTSNIGRALSARVGNLCSNPSCQALTSGPHEEAAKAVNLGVAAHITAAAPGGSRYDPALTVEQRASAENAIWLCQNCARLIDNDPGRFPVELLRRWKEQAEEHARSRVGRTASPAATGATYNITIERSIIGGFGAGDGVHVSGAVSVPTDLAASVRAAQSREPGPSMRTPTAEPSTTGAATLASVYLSYGDDDLLFAQGLYEALEASGVPVFFRHEHAVPRARRHRSARRSIREYEHVILLCSERSLRAPSVLSDLDEMLSREFGEGASERILPVLLDDFAENGWQPRHPDIRQTVLDRVPLDMKGADRDRAKFEKALKRLLGALKG